MVQTLAISEGLTLKYLRESFNLSWVQEPDFFPEGQSDFALFGHSPGVGL